VSAVVEPPGIEIATVAVWLPRGIPDLPFEVEVVSAVAGPRGIAVAIVVVWLPLGMVV
jgi:hypothetical protein